jgi:cobalt/nickel transport system permease protein
MNELYVAVQSPIHALDARVKLVLTLAFLVCLSLTPSGDWTVYLIFFILLLAAELISRLAPGFFMKRALLALPFMLAALPLVFTGPAPLTPLRLPGGVEIAVSNPGAVRFAAIAVKTWISVQAAVLLAATTPLPDLLFAMRSLKAPALFVAVIALMGRYLVVIVEEARSMLRARSSRSADTPNRRVGGSLAWRAQVTGGMAGGLFLRSLERSDRLYAAMLSRGYTGDLPVQSPPALSRIDWLTLGMGLILFAGIFGLSIIMY